MTPTASEMLSAMRANGINHTSVIMWTGFTGGYWVALEANPFDSRLGRTVQHSVTRRFKTEPEALAVYQEHKTP